MAYRTDFQEHSNHNGNLIGRQFNVRLLTPAEGRTREAEAATLLKIESELFLFLFDEQKNEVWIPLTQITSMVEIKAAAASRDLAASSPY